jgi:hypothetical protein
MIKPMSIRWGRLVLRIGLTINLNEILNGKYEGRGHLKDAREVIWDHDSNMDLKKVNSKFDLGSGLTQLI